MRGEAKEIICVERVLSPARKRCFIRNRLKRMRPDAATGGGVGGIPKSAYFLRQTLYNRTGNNKGVNER